MVSAIVRFVHAAFRPVGIVTVHLETLCQNLSKADKKKVSAAEVMAWLAECGFKLSAGMWVVEELSLDVLDKT